MKIVSLIFSNILFVYRIIRLLLLTIFGQCLHFIPSENTRKPVFRGYKMDINEKILK